VPSFIDTRSADLELKVAASLTDRYALNMVQDRHTSNPTFVSEPPSGQLHHRYGCRPGRPIS